ncbi:hypothetical protein [Georgenia sp. SUBG003]|uniref:hypothetical protein n=1 Tax=Georgenia sp. SUBG003 TaxID=1497974 RepID=UPI0004D4EADF|nr:hypothetical protein DA06_28595 [Georgenia sp. SUBG003]
MRTWAAGGEVEFDIAPWHGGKRKFELPDGTTVEGEEAGDDLTFLVVDIMMQTWADRRDLSAEVWAEEPRTGVVAAAGR